MFPLIACADKSVFSSKRTQQIETANRILGLDNYSKQYKMVEMLMEAIFPVSKIEWLR